MKFVGFDRVSIGFPSSGMRRSNTFSGASIAIQVIR